MGTISRALAHASLACLASPLAAQSVSFGPWPAAFAALSGADIQRMIGWYRDTLGFEVLSQGEAPNGIAKFATMKHGAALLELIQHGDARLRASYAANLDAHEVHGFF